MKEFILAALPFIIIGICLAIICANFKNDKKTYKNGRITKQQVNKRGYNKFLEISKEW